MEVFRPDVDGKVLGKKRLMETDFSSFLWRYLLLLLLQDLMCLVLTSCHSLSQASTPPGRPKTWKSCNHQFPHVFLLVVFPQWQLTKTPQSPRGSENTNSFIEKKRQAKENMIYECYWHSINDIIYHILFNIHYAHSDSWLKLAFMHNLICRNSQKACATF